MALPTISVQNVQSLKALEVKKKDDGQYDTWKCRPVWLVTLRDGTRMVVKQEVKAFATAQKSAVFGAKIMKNIDGETKASALSDPELQVLSRLPTFTMGGLGLPAPTTSLSRDYLRFCMQNPNGIWIKMAFVENLVGLDKVLKSDMDSRNLLLDMRIDERILSSLGEVIAGDIFVGNEDRFTHSGRNLGAVVNAGNILFKAQQGTKGVGLDWFQAQGEFSNLYSAPPPDWAGPLLNNAQEITRFSKRAISDLNGLFAEKLDDLRTPDLLTEYNAGNLEDGIIAGRDKLKTYLVTKTRKDATAQSHKVPGGVLIRMQILGWNA